MNASDLRKWKAPMPTKGKYLLRVIKAEAHAGRKPDINGDVSKAHRLQLEICSPEGAAMSDSSSALGFKFQFDIWYPRRSLEESNPGQAKKMHKAIQSLLFAIYGDDWPSTDDSIMAGEGMEGKCFWAYCHAKFDDYQGEEILVPEQFSPMKPDDLAALPF